MRFAHCMIRVGDLERSLGFYCDLLGMKLLRREDYPDGRFTLAFVGYGNLEQHCSIELTHNWDTRSYEHHPGFGHLAMEVDNVTTVCSRLASAGVKIIRHAGPMTHRSPDRSSPEIIAFISDPDGYRIELVENPMEGMST